MGHPLGCSFSNPTPPTPALYSSLSPPPCGACCLRCPSCVLCPSNAAPFNDSGIDQQQGRRRRRQRHQEKPRKLVFFFSSSSRVSFSLLVARVVPHRHRSRLRQRRRHRRRRWRWQLVGGGRLRRGEAYPRRLAAVRLPGSVPEVPTPLGAVGGRGRGGRGEWN